VVGLLDSIARNYPIGSILLWQSRQELASEQTLAGLPIAAHKPDYPVNYLLDGQQRLSTICGALYWRPNGDPDSMWNIAYDLRTGSFMHLHTLDDPPLSQVPLRYLADAASYFRRTTALDDDAMRQRADGLFNRVQDYMIAAVTLGDMPIDDIAPIFERINSTATRLTIVDLMRAATWKPEFDLRDAIDSVLNNLSARDFAGIDRKTVLRTIAAAAGFGFAVDDIDRLRTKSVEDLNALMNEVDESAKRAVDFLATHIRVPRPEALPYTNQFAVLTELFRRVPTPDAAQFTAIEKWFWRTTLGGYFGGWNTGQMAHDYAALTEFAAGTTADLEVPTALPRKEVWSVTQFRSNSAISKMLALMLSFADPVDLVTGQRIDARRSLAWSNDKEFHHFFPKAYLLGEGAKPGAANAVGNIILLTSISNIQISSSAPSEYLKILVADLGRDELVRRLATVMVSEEALDAALENDFDSFMKIRAATLHEAALQLAGEKAEEAADGPAEVPGETLVGDEVDPDEIGESDESRD